jgi:hypothetical protein
VPAKLFQSSPLIVNIPTSLGRYGEKVYTGKLNFTNLGRPEGCKTFSSGISLIMGKEKFIEFKTTRSNYF